MKIQEPRGGETGMGLKQVWRDEDMRYEMGYTVHTVLTDLFCTMHGI